MNKIYFGDNLTILKSLESESIDLIYIDPPFNTGKTQKRRNIKTVRTIEGDRTGFQGARYKTIEIDSREYKDSFNGLSNNIESEEIVFSYRNLAPYANTLYLEDFLKPRLIEAYRLLKPHGSLYFHIDYRESHYCKILLDRIFGRDSFLNEVIWAYDFGGRSRSKWPAKHDNIFLYVKDPQNYYFSTHELSREDYLAPGLVGPEKSKRGKLPTDTFWWGYVGKKGMFESDVVWQTIVGTNSRERFGYPSQKPIELIDRLVLASSASGDTVLDFFAGSGTIGESCYKNGRNFILIDNNIQSIEVMANRFDQIEDLMWVGIKGSDLKKFSEKKPKYLINHNINSANQNSKKFKELVKITSNIQDDFEKESDIWKNSPFEWIAHLPPRSKSKIARQILLRWLENEKVSIKRAEGINENLIIGKKTIAIKNSMLWKSNVYRFQQIRTEGPDYLICFGISPKNVHCWVLTKKLAIEKGRIQHRGANGSEYWLTIDPYNIDNWLLKCGGSLEKVTELLKML